MGAFPLILLSVFVLLIRFLYNNPVSNTMLYTSIGQHLLLKRSQTRFVEQNQTNLTNQKESLITANIDPLFEQKLELATEGLEPHFLEHLKTKISADNALTISKYILSMRVETSLSTNYRRTIISSLKLLSEFLSNKPFPLEDWPGNHTQTVSTPVNSER